MTPQVNFLFPTPVVRFKYTKSFSRELAFIKSLSYSEASDRDNQISIEKYVLNLPELSEIKSFILEAVKEYAINIYASLNDLKITQSWTNKNVPGRGHHLHNHPNSILSGVFYFQSDDSSIKFHNSIQKTFQLKVSSLNDFNCGYSQLAVSSGDLLIFPSDLLHSVPANQSLNERISLAFNTFVDGNLGDSNLLNEVIVN